MATETNQTGESALSEGDLAKNSPAEDAPKAATKEKSAAKTPAPAPVKRKYNELPADTMLAFKVEKEVITSDEFSDSLSTVKQSDLRFFQKAFWENVEKDEKGNSRYLRIRLIGIATKSKGSESYDGYEPFDV